MRATSASRSTIVNLISTHKWMLDWRLSPQIFAVSLKFSKFNSKTLLLKFLRIESPNPFFVVSLTFFVAIFTNCLILFSFLTVHSLTHFFSLKNINFLLFSDKIKVQCSSQNCEDGALVMSTEHIVDCHRHLCPRQPNNELDHSLSSSSSSDSASLDSSRSSCLSPNSGSNGGRERQRHSSMTFRVKSGRVEAEKSVTDNHWAGQCQSKVRYRHPNFSFYKK